MGKGVKGFERGNRQGLSTRFSVQNQPKNNGRKLSFRKKAVSADNSLSKRDFIEIIKWIIELPLGELEKLQKRTDLPAWINEYITAILGDIKKGRFKTLNYTFNLMFGKSNGYIIVKHKFAK